MATTTDCVPNCPGCHIRCRVDDFQCGRGERFHARWASGKELPERRVPGTMEQPGAAGAAPSDGRLMHLLHIVGIALEDLERECGADEDERRVVDCIMRQGKAASARIVGQRTRLPEDRIGAALENLVASGLAEARQPLPSTVLFQLTPAGLERARAWQDDRAAAEARFLSALTETEKGQLADLVFKILKPGFERMRA